MTFTRSFIVTIVLAFCLTTLASKAANDCTWPIMREGNSGRDTFTIQYLLSYRGYSLSIDGIWGKGTTTALKSFQQKNGLGADGVIGPLTWIQLVPYPIAKGSKGLHVKAAQDQLAYRYSYSIGVDGDFGAGTQNAVLDFNQKRTHSSTTNIELDTWLDLVQPDCNATDTTPSPPSSGRTVQQAINAAGCSTAVCKGLSAQLVTQSNCIQSGLFVNIAGHARISLNDAANAVPYLQSAASNDLDKATKERGKTIIINSALRTLPQQLMLYKWYQMKKCGITAAAAPGRSNHNGGAAIDIGDPYAWQTALEHHNWKKLGDWDRMHYDYTKAKDVRSISVKAFQKLWNLNNPNDKIAEDGAYGPSTESRILKSPVDGFSKSKC